MPIYEFRCNSCRKIFEEFLRHNDSIVDVACPVCRSNNIEKLFSAFAVDTRAKFKGEYTPDTACDEMTCIPRRPTPFDEPFPSHRNEENSYSSPEFDEAIE